MTQQPDTSEAQPVLPLKIEEQDHDPKNPWGDDVLDREKVAHRLTSIIREHDLPFVISVDGGWGTGKTFLLKRWKQDLQNQGWEAIYYNAWEDDFCDDPLVAIVGQLSEHFDKGNLADTVCEIARLVPPLLDLAAPLVPFGQVWGWLRAVPNAIRGHRSPPESVRRYQERRATANDFRQGLTKLGAEVRKSTGHPLVFIIDELDRCRPSFAIELLERVKHVFDVPNIVFVFGINRSELVKSFHSAYGDIDAATYLRRFFDMDFSLPEPSAVRFCEHLVKKFGLNNFFWRLGSTQDREIGVQVDLVAPVLPLLLGNMGLSLRDMDYCVRLVALAVASDDRRFSVDPYLLAALVAVKIRNPELHRRFVEGNARAADVIDYIDELVRESRRTFADPEMYDEDGLDRIAAAIYCTDVRRVAWSQFQRAVAGSTLEHPEYLSKEHQRWIHEDTERLNRIARVVDEYTRSDARFGIDLYAVASLIDLTG